MMSTGHMLADVVAIIGKRYSRFFKFFLLFFIPLVGLKSFVSFYARKNAQYAYCNYILFYQLSKLCKLAIVKSY